MILAYSSEEFSSLSIHVLIDGLADSIVDDIQEFRFDIISHSRSTRWDSSRSADNSSVHTRLSIIEFRNCQALRCKNDLSGSNGYRNTS
jgi:hypothetical protein